MEMTFEEWKEKYKPFTDFPVDWVENPNPNTVWTMKAGDNGYEYLQSGVHYVNRIGYYETEVPYNDGEYVFITISEGYDEDEDEDDDWIEIEEESDSEEKGA